MNKSFAAFDIDGTLYRGNLTWDFFSQLISESIISGDLLKSLESFHIAHDSRTHDNAYSEYDVKLISIFCEGLAQISDLTRYWEIGKTVGQKSSKRLYRFTREKLAEFKEQGYYLIGITNSIGAVAKPFAKELGFDFVISNDEILSSDSNKIESWSIYSRNMTKGELLAKLIKDLKLKMEGSYAIGDTMADSSMLEIVPYPIAFNPEKRLQELAIQKNWHLVVERKNVVYDLIQKNDFVLNIRH